VSDFRCDLCPVRKKCAELMKLVEEVCSVGSDDCPLEILIERDVRGLVKRRLGEEDDDE